jgi:hypothetical protein
MEQQMEFNCESSIRGYLVYKSIWTYEIGEKLRCDREENNPNEKSAVKLVRNDGNKEQCVGHVPIEHSKVFTFFHFLLCHNEVSRRSRMSRLIYIRDNLE